MKRLIGIAIACSVAMAAFRLVAADTMPRSEWHNLVSDCAQDPAKMKETVGKLSEADQLAFLGEVNEAIGKMPGSNDAKAAAFYEANKAAMTGASKSNRTAMLAEVFATVPTEYLTVINERFATELFSRDANPARPYSDDEFTQLSTNTMAVVAERCQNAENGGVREAFAALMLVRASGGSPSNLSSTLVSQISDASAREAAGGWISSAMGADGEKSYDGMLAASQGGEEPNLPNVASVAGPAAREAMLADLAGQKPGEQPTTSDGGGVFAPPSIVGVGPGNNDDPTTSINRVPRAYVESDTAVGGDQNGRAEGSNPYYSGSRGSGSAGSGVSSDTPTEEPSVYVGQGI